MNVLSLFDGMSCGQIALNKAGIRYNNYFASEIDKPSIKVTTHNYPKTIQLGDVTKWQDWNLPKIDLIIGGSPCQGFSRAGEKLNFADERSKLFFDFVDILKHYKPEYFLLENVKMKKEWEVIINNILGVEGVHINSSLVSAQKRERVYWSNIKNISNPKDKNIFISDIFDVNTRHNEIKIHFPETIKRGKNYAQYDQTLKGHGSQDQRFFYFDGKTNCVTKSRSSIPKVEYKNKILIMNPEEVEKLQTVPVGYTGVETKQNRYSMLGNGWTVDIIAYIFSGMEARN